MVTSWLGSAAAAEREYENREAQIYQLRERIQEIKAALEHHPDSEKTGQWKEPLKESEKKLEGVR